MSRICNKEEEASSSLYDQVDAPIATGSAHFMRAGAELHLMHSDLELRDTVQAALRVASARCAIAAAIDDYESSHRLARELGFYTVHDQRLQDAGMGSAGVFHTLRDAQDLGLVDLDESTAAKIDRKYREGGDEAVFTGFIAELKDLAATLAAFDPAAADADPEMWARFAWSSVTAFDRIRIYGQTIAIVNIFGMSRATSAPAGR